MTYIDLQILQSVALSLGMPRYLYVPTSSIFILLHPT
jgi:hypothetical protein